MPEPASEPNVVITASPHDHPAVRKLARACIALARHQLTTESADVAEQVTESNNSGSQPEEPTDV